MHHRSPEKGSNRIDGNRCKRRASQGSNRDCRIEKPCLKRFGIKAAHLTDHLGDRIGGGACENRHGQKTSADDPQTEKRSEEQTSELQSTMRISYAVFCLKKT